MSERIENITTCLQQAFAPESMSLDDESYKHAGHAGAKSGGGHYVLSIVSSKFESLGTLQRHRAVYEALGSLMQTDIHALNIHAFAPDEI